MPFQTDRHIAPLLENDLHVHRFSRPSTSENNFLSPILVEPVSRLLMHGSAVRGLRLIDTSRSAARDLSRENLRKMRSRWPLSGVSVSPQAQRD